MKVYVATAFKGFENEVEIEELCSAVKAAGHDDFCFTRDVEDYQQFVADTKELWECVQPEIDACEALIIDVSRGPDDECLAQASIAYGLKKSVFVIAKKGIAIDEIYDGMATLIIRYRTYDDIVEPMKSHAIYTGYQTSTALTVVMLLALVAVSIAWGLSQVFLPLGFVWLVVCWLVGYWIMKKYNLSSR